LIVQSVANKLIGFEQLSSEQMLLGNMDYITVWTER